MENTYVAVRVLVCLLLLACYLTYVLGILMYASPIIESSRPDISEAINSSLDRYVWSLHPMLLNLRDVLATWATWPTYHPLQILFTLFVLVGLLALPGPGSNKRAAKALYLTCLINFLIAISVLLIIVNPHLPIALPGPVIDFASQMLSNIGTVILIMALIKVMV